MAKGRPIGAKLLLEGMEVPMIGATLTHSVNQASIAYIDLVPHAIINNIKPRTLVQLFVRDYHNEAGGFPFVLAFEGEVFGFSFGKTTTSRSFSISAIDYSSYWDNVLTYFFNAQQSLSKGSESLAPVGMDQADVKAAGATLQSVTHSVSSFFLKTIEATLKQPIDGRKADFLDGFVAVYKQIAKINDFYNTAEDRLRIVDRILLKSSGELETLLKQSEALEWFNGIAGRTTGYATLRSVIQDLMSIIFHDFVSVPFPAKVNHTKMAKGGVSETDSVQKTIGEFIFKPNLYMVPPPACNVFYPDEYSNFQFTRNFFQEPTRLIYQPEMPRGFGGGDVVLSHVYQPDSFDHFMLKKGSAKDGGFIGDSDLQIDQEYGHFNENDTNATTSQTNQGKKREQQFLTNEEKMRGILMAKENMVPASTQFRQSLTDVGKRTFSAGIAKYLFFKKRYETRGVQITSHLKLSVVPGFTTLILDDSDADQTVVAYCSSVTHRIYATQGGFTNTTLSYARTVNEEDTASGKAGQMLVPPWFTKEVFGVIGPVNKPTDEEKELGDQLVVADPKRLSAFYAELLGAKGSRVVLDITGKTTMVGAARKLAAEYKAAKSKGTATNLISKMTSRDYVTIREAMRFVGATTETRDFVNNKFVEFSGDRLKGKGANDLKQIKARRQVIIDYRRALQRRRGFRG